MNDEEPIETSGFCLISVNPGGVLNSIRNSCQTHLTVVHGFLSVSPSSHPKGEPTSTHSDYGTVPEYVLHSYLGSTAHNYLESVTRLCMPRVKNKVRSRGAGLAGKVT
jgi:hypothetical protein